MAAGFRDLLDWLFGWRSSLPRTWQTEGPYRVAAGATFAPQAVGGAVAHAAPAAGMVCADNVARGCCYG